RSAHGIGLFSVVGAVVVGTIAVAAVYKVGGLLDGERYALLATATYIALPLFGLLGTVAPARHSFLTRAAPGIVGLSSPGRLLIGVAVTALAAVVPRWSQAAFGVIAAAVALAVYGLGDLGEVRSGLHETAWSIALLEWLMIAGTVGVSRR